MADSFMPKKAIMQLEELRAAIQPHRQALLQHPVYRDMRGADALRRFMEYHVFAVWDFMSLLKALQQRLCCVSIPWMPVPPSAGSRFINEIVLGEETDDDGHGGYASHFDMYHRAMTRFGADTTTIDRFLHGIRDGLAVTAALRFAKAPEPVCGFVEHTFEVIAGGDLCRIASAFTFGREDLLPDVFQTIVDELGNAPDGRLDDFRYYLRRHIELDGDEHGPMAERLMSSLCGTDGAKWNAATAAAVAALQARLRLWDGIHAAIRHPHDTAWPESLAS
jgi:hypothetical protein